jgi:hypothetical protein
MFDSKKKTTAPGVVALIKASDDTVDMIQKILTEINDAQTLVWCHFAELKKGIINFEKYIGDHNPEVVIFVISHPYHENWHFFEMIRNSDALRGRGLVLMTTNKARLDEASGSDSKALEMVGLAKDLKEIKAEILAQTNKGRKSRMALA